MRFASLKSPNPAVRARLQAALFANRKRNKARRALSDTPAGWVVGRITLGFLPGESLGYEVDYFGSIQIQPNTEFVMAAIYFNETDIYLSFYGDLTTDLIDSLIRINGVDYPVNNASINFDTTLTRVEFVCSDFLYIEGDQGTVVNFEIVTQS